MTPNDGLLMTNAQIATQSLLSSAEVKRPSDYSRVSVVLSGSIPNLALTYPIEIAIQSVPQLENFSPRLFLVERNDASERQSDNDDDRCVYSYKFAAGTETMISRFVRIDKLSSTHLEPDFRIDSASSCSSSFFIYNSGCMALKSSIFTSDESSTQTEANNRKCPVVIKSGEYKIEFKLCFYDTNKVSCSQLYNQTLVVEQDISRSSSLRIKAVSESSDEKDSFGGRLEYQRRREFKSGLSSLSTFFNSRRHGGFSVYLLALLIVICVIAFIALVSFLFVFLRRPRGVRKSSSSKKISNSSSDSDKILVLPNSKDFRNLEISTESTPCSASSSGSQSGNCSNTPETSSNATTASSKVCKTDDEVLNLFI